MVNRRSKVVGKDGEEGGDGKIRASVMLLVCALLKGAEPNKRSADVGTGQAMMDLSASFPVHWKRCISSKLSVTGTNPVHQASLEEQSGCSMARERQKMDER